MPEGLHLENLPPEVIHSIAVHCNGDSALALARTSKTLHDICYSWRVFQAIVRSAVYGVSPLHETRSEELAATSDFRFAELARLVGRNAQVWARYAVAINRASVLEDKSAALSPESDEACPFALARPQLAQYLSYMPQLLCLGYKHRTTMYTAIDSFRDICRSTLAPRTFDWHYVNPDKIDWRYKAPDGTERLVDGPALKFCFLMEIMTGQIGGGYARRALREGLGAERIYRDMSLRRIIEKLTASLDTYDIATCLSFNLRLSSGESHPFFRPTYLPPSFHKFPLLYSEPRYFGPLRFAPFSSQDNCLVVPDKAGQAAPLMPLQVSAPKVASCEFIKPYLQTGEWCGYYRVGLSITETLCPLHSIKLSLDTSDTPAHLVIKGTGVIGTRPCEVRGWLNLGGGQGLFSMCLIRTGGVGGHPVYPINGQLTPFGLTGNITLDAVTDAKIWLWNKAWHDTGQVEEAHTSPS